MIARSLHLFCSRFICFLRPDVRFHHGTWILKANKPEDFSVSNEPYKSVLIHCRAIWVIAGRAGVAKAVHRVHRVT